MKGKKTALMMSTLLVLSALTLALDIQPVKGLNFISEVTVSPENPTTNDNIYVTVNFTFCTWPPYVKEFGQPIQVGNTFSINVTIYVPAPADIVLMVVHSDENTYSLGNLPEGTYQFQVYAYHVHYTEGMYYLAKSVSFTVTPPPTLTATVDINPAILNLRNKETCITAYIELPEGYNVSDINISSILLNDTVQLNPATPLTIEDYDNDIIPDLKVEFDGITTASHIQACVNITELIKERFMSITLTITGNLNDGAPFTGSTTIRITYLCTINGRFHVYPI